MTNTFTHTLTIPDNASDSFGFCKPSMLWDICQEAGNRHSLVLGYARDDLPEGVVWVLVKAFLRLTRPVLRQEKVDVTTWYRGCLGAQVYRDYDIHAGGEFVGEGVTVWATFDIAKQRPVRPSIAKETRFMYDRPKTLVLGKPDRPEAARDAGTRPVRYSDLDMNGHMNNIKYIDVICDALRLEERPGAYLRSTEIHYVGQTLPGQILQLQTGGLPDGRIYISGSADGKRTFESAVLLGGI